MLETLNKPNGLERPSCDGPRGQPIFEFLDGEPARRWREHRMETALLCGLQDLGQEIDIERTAIGAGEAPAHLVDAVHIYGMA